MKEDEESQKLHELIEEFIDRRLSAKLENLPADDPKREKLAAQFELKTWVTDAARRVSQLQVITHSLKPLHPDAKGSNLYAPPETLTSHKLVGSHELPEAFDEDVVGNAAALDVYKFLKLEHQGRTLLERVLSGDDNLAAALSDNPEEAGEWMEAFAAITEPGRDQASHTHAKQLYWLAGDDPTDNEHYHLLAPLYATSLAHQVHQTINADRFGDAAKEARKARKSDQFSRHGYRDYPELAIQKLGGTKPQNISQLNSERGGNNYLLASLPPTWMSSELKPPFFIDSVFARFGRQRRVRWLVQGLRELLIGDPAPNKQTRDRRDEYLGALVDELMAFAAEYSFLEPGWTASPDCRLVESEALWLDPWRDDDDFVRRRADGGWAEDVASRFAAWLNQRLSDVLPVGDAEHAFWARHLQQHAHDLQEVMSNA